MKAAEKAYNRLRGGIIEGVFAPGVRITEQEVAEAIGVSRTPVREAMRRLLAEGLLEFVPHQGAFVKTWNDKDVDEIFELRSLLESYAAKRAASHASEDDIRRMRELGEAQYAEVETQAHGFLERIADLNEEFHKLLSRSAHNDRLESILSTLADAPLVFETFRDYTKDELVRSARHHLEIVNALEQGDGEWASSVMRSHVLAARQVMEQATGTAGETPAS